MGRLENLMLRQAENKIHTNRYDSRTVAASRNISLAPMLYVGRVSMLRHMSNTSQHTIAIYTSASKVVFARTSTRANEFFFISIGH